MLGLVDSLAQRFHSVVSVDWHRLLGEDRAGIQVCGHDVHSRARHLDARVESLLDSVQAAGEIGKQRRMNVDDAPAERLQEGLGVDSVVARIDDQLHSMRQEEVPHRGVTLLGRPESFLRKLSQRNAPLARKSRASTHRSIGGDRDHIEAALHKVAQV